MLRKRDLTAVSMIIAMGNDLRTITFEKTYRKYVNFMLASVVDTIWRPAVDVCSVLPRLSLHVLILSYFIYA